MIPPFDIFKVESASVRWLESAADLESARARVNALAASSPSEYIIVNQKTGEKISIKPKSKRIVFQIGYDERELKARAEVLRRFGHEVTSVGDNTAAKTALATIRDVDLFILGHSAPDETVQEMLAWLRANYPNVKILALNPSKNRELPGADYNVTLNDYDEWLSLLAAAGI